MGCDEGSSETSSVRSPGNKQTPEHAPKVDGDGHEIGLDVVVTQSADNRREKSGEGVQGDVDGELIDPAIPIVSN